MDGDNVTSYNYGGASQSQQPSVEGTNQTQGTNQTSSPDIDKGKYYDSTILKSEIEQLQLLMQIAAGFPILLAPAADNQNNGSQGSSSGVSNANASIRISMNYANKEHEIISSMWDTFINQIREFAKRTQKIDEEDRQIALSNKAADTAAEYLSRLLTSSAVQTVEGTVKGSNEKDSALAVQFDSAFKYWLSPDNAIANGSTNYPSSTFVAGALASNTDLLQGASTVTALALVLDLKITTSPVADAIFAVGPTSGLPGDYQAAAALVASLLNAGAVAKAATDTIQQKAPGQPIRDLAFAINYGKSIMAIVTRPADKNEQTNKMRAEQNQLIRLMLSTMALNLVYRSAYGGMTGEEFADLLDNDNPDLPDEIKPHVQELVSLIKSFLPKDPAARAEMISRLMDYVDTKHSVDSMLNTTKGYDQMLKSSDTVEGNRQEIIRDI